jgi:hypothetical protein
MRWTVRTVAAIALVWIAYAAWPFSALYGLVDAVQSRDGTAVARRVNFPAVRQSLTEQIVVTYLRLTGRDARLGQFGRGMAVAGITSIADPIVAKLLSAEALMELLNVGWPTTVLPDKATTFQGLSSGALGDIWQVFVQSEQGLRRFEIAVPMAAPPARQFKLQFRLTTWVWKLSGVELPEELRVRLAQELIKQIEKK